MKGPILVTDLDNTLYDWVSYYVPSFRAMVRQLVDDTGECEDVLLHDFKGVHQKHGTVEYSFSIEELPSLLVRYPGGVPREVVVRAASRFREEKQKSLRLYPGVSDTLALLRSMGVRVFAYTEANSYQAIDRLNLLGVSQYFEMVYATKDHALPAGRRRSGIAVRFGRPIHGVPSPYRKPNPAVLELICRELQTPPSHLVYVGDSLVKDVRMAQAAGALDVWAQYGAVHDPQLYRFLVKISHWTPEMVEREKRLSAQEVHPSHVIRSFPEIIDLINRSYRLGRSQAS